MTFEQRDQTILSQAPGDRAMELPVQKPLAWGTESTWHTVVLSSPGAGDRLKDEWQSPVLRMPEDSWVSSSVLLQLPTDWLTDWATESPSPADEGPLGLAVSPEPSGEDPGLPVRTVTPS